MELLTRSRPQTIFSMREERILDPFELGSLRAARRRFLRGIAGLETGGWALLLAVATLASNWLSMENVALTLGILASVLFAAHVGEMVFPRVAGLVSDLHERQKEVVSGEVKKVNLIGSGGGAYEYYVMLHGSGEEKFFVPGDDWRKIQKGDRIEIHRAKHSKVVLKVVFIAGEIGEELPDN